MLKMPLLVSSDMFTTCLKKLIPFAASSCTLVGILRADITLEPRGTYESGVFDESAAEIVDFDSKSKRLFVVNGASDAIDVLDASDVEAPELLFSIPIKDGSPNSVAVDPRPWVKEIAIAVESEVVTDPGRVEFYDIDGNFLKEIEVGALPDMLTYSPRGWVLAVANEGEPDEGIDPEGSISLIPVWGGAKWARQSQVRTVGFGSLDKTGAPEGLRLFPDVDTIAQDLEPEYIAFSPYGNEIMVTLQEANAVAIIDVWRARLKSVVPLGTIDHSFEGFGIDASDKDGEINISPRPVRGMFMPDSIASYTYRGQVYYLTANEGDDRGEDERVGKLNLDLDAFPDAEILQKNEELGRLGVSTIDGDTDGDGDYDQLFSYGTRSFSIWDSRGQLVFDSGDDFEMITSMLLPDDFNSSNDENGDFEGRSDNKGPEPEAITTGRIWGRTYAFIGLERIGGIVVYDVTNPTEPEYIEYVNTRDFSGNPEAGTAGDLGPEGLKFIPSHKSPTRHPLLVVANEVSGTTTLFEIKSTRNRPWRWHRGCNGFRR